MWPAPELDGRTSLADLGLARMASRRKPFVGSALMKREGMADAQRPCLVGLELANGTGQMCAGAILRAPSREYMVTPLEGVPVLGEKTDPHPLGFISSVSWSPELGKAVGLGLVSGEEGREGQIVDAIFPLLRRDDARTHHLAPSCRR